MPKKKPAKKKAKKAMPAKVITKRRAAKKKTAAKKKPVAKKKLAARKKTKGKTYTFEQNKVAEFRSSASNRAGQSGDIQGLSDVEEADSESVEELAEEGQSLEAEVVDGVENAPDADRGPVHTHEVPEDDVPGEYEDKDRL